MKTIAKSFFLVQNAKLQASFWTTLLDWFQNIFVDHVLFTSVVNDIIFASFAVIVRSSFHKLFPQMTSKLRQNLKVFDHRQVVYNMILNFCVSFLFSYRPSNLNELVKSFKLKMKKVFFSVCIFLLNWLKRIVCHVFFV